MEAWGFNAMVFHVRTHNNALYKSELNPIASWWSKVNFDEFDPLEWSIQACHDRGIEFHAWMNPYRITTSGSYPSNSYETKYPEGNPGNDPSNFITVGNSIILDPGIPSNRDFIVDTCMELVENYDVDAIHFDDYFYPYPAPGKEFADDKWFKKSGAADKDEWRRENVNLLIKQIHEVVREVKPWVKFGVSPFGIYRNKGSWKHGSETNGLQCYDDLYADVLLWIDKGWVDYCIPQIYWEIGHRAADYAELVKWWAQYASKRPLYVGQDVQRTVKAKDRKSPTGNQQHEKYAMQRAEKNIQGSCFWDAASAANNVDGYRKVLEEGLFRYPALMPEHPFIDSKAPKKLRGVRMIDVDGQNVLVWLPKKKRVKNELDKPHRYVLYCFAKGEKIDLDDPSKIVTITSDTSYKIPEGMEGKYTFVVTVIDRMHNESAAVKCKVKL